MNAFCVLTLDLYLYSIYLVNLKPNYGYMFAHARYVKRSYNDILSSGGTWSNKLTKQEIKDKFEDYYDCITKMNKQATDKKESIEAVLALEGQRVELKCTICTRPDRDPKDERNFWQIVQTADSTIRVITEDTKGMKVSEDMTLLIHSIDVKDAGQYFCVNGDDAVLIYQVDVLFKEPLHTMNSNQTGTQLIPSRNLVDHNLQVFSQWANWGECDSCGREGRRVMFGICMVRKIVPGYPIMPVDIPIMSMYPHGVPCRSTVLSRQVAHLPGIHGRKSQVLVGPCQVPCPSTPAPIQVTNEYGKVIDIIEAGYQPLRKKPDLPDMVIRKVLYKSKGIQLTLTCPTSNNGKIRWQRGERPINPSTIRQQTRGRVSIDRLNRLVFARLREHDTAPYSCWVWKSHIATIKVIVYAAVNEEVKLIITYGGLFLTVFTLLTYCTFKLCFGKPKRSRG